MNGTAKAYQVTVTAPTKEQAAQEAAQKIVSMLGNNTSNWKALGVGATIQDSNNNKNWNTTVIFYNPSQESQFVKKTSNGPRTAFLPHVQPLCSQGPWLERKAPTAPRARRGGPLQSPPLQPPTIKDWIYKREIISESQNWVGMYL